MRGCGTHGEVQFSSLRASPTRALLGVYVVTLALAASGRDAQPRAAVASADAALREWRIATNDIRRAAAATLLESVVRDPSRSDFLPGLTYAFEAALADGTLPAFIARCDTELQPRADAARRHTLVVMTAQALAKTGKTDDAVARLSTEVETLLRAPDAAGAQAALAESAQMYVDLLVKTAGKASRAAELLEQHVRLADGAPPAVLAALLNLRAQVLDEQRLDAAQAEACLRRVLQFGADCPSKEYWSASQRLARMRGKDGPTNAVAEVLAQALCLFPDGAPAGIGRTLVECGATAAQQDRVLASLRRVLIQGVSADPQGTLLQRLQPEIVELMTAAGRNEEAVAESRVFLLCAPDKLYPQAVSLAARSLKLLDGDLRRANRFLAFQKAGSVGTDGKAGTEDDLHNDLWDVRTPQDTVRAQRLRELALAGSTNWEEFLKDVALYCYLDAPAQAFERAQRAFALCPMAQPSLQRCADAMCRVVLVATRDEALAQRLIDFLLTGTAGPDGVAGTPDDLKDPRPEALERLRYRTEVLPTATAAAQPAAVN